MGEDGDLDTRADVGDETEGEGEVDVGRFDGDAGADADAEDGVQGGRVGVYYYWEEFKVCTVAFFGGEMLACISMVCGKPGKGHSQGHARNLLAKHGDIQRDAVVELDMEPVLERHVCVGAEDKVDGENDPHTEVVT